LVAAVAPTVAALAPVWFMSVIVTEVLPNGFAHMHGFSFVSGAQRPRLSSPWAGFCHAHLRETFAGVFALTGCAAQRDFRGTPGMAPAPANQSWGHFSTTCGVAVRSGSTRDRTKDQTERIEQ
jgi:hypothetical protein